MLISFNVKLKCSLIVKPTQEFVGDLVEVTSLKKRN